MWLDEDRGEAVVYANGSWRLPYSVFVDKPEKDQTIWVEADNLWNPAWVKIHANDPNAKETE